MSTERTWRVPGGATLRRHPVAMGGVQWTLEDAPWWVSVTLDGPHSAGLQVTIGGWNLIRSKPGLSNVPMAWPLVGRWWVSKDHPTFVQHKGTNLCMDVYCPSCGDQSHIDSDFVYYLECPHCLTVFEVGVRLSLKPVARSDAWGIKRAEV